MENGHFLCDDICVISVCVFVKNFITFPVKRLFVDLTDKKCDKFLHKTKAEKQAVSVFSAKHTPTQKIHIRKC